MIIWMNFNAKNFLLPTSNTKIKSSNDCLSWQKKEVWVVLEVNVKESVGVGCGIKEVIAVLQVKMKVSAWVDGVNVVGHKCKVVCKT